VKLLIAACALILALSVLAGCGGLSAKQRLARREAIHLFPHVGLVSRHLKITSIDIRGGNWADVIGEGHLPVPNTGCLPGGPCHPGLARRVRLGFALHDPRHHWNMSYDFGHGF
jgi:hypothetical protein